MVRVGLMHSSGKKRLKRFKGRFVSYDLIRVLFLLIDCITFGADLRKAQRATLIVAQLGSRLHRLHFDLSNIPKCCVETLATVLNPVAHILSPLSQASFLVGESL